MEICQKRGWILDDSLTINDLGISALRGKNVKCGALGEFVEAIKIGHIQKGSVLILENIDRLSRDKVGIAFQLFTEILNSGITIVTAEPEWTYTQDSINDIAGIIEPIMYMSRAHEESPMKSVWLTSGCTFAMALSRTSRCGLQTRPTTPSRPRYSTCRKRT